MSNKFVRTLTKSNEGIRKERAENFAQRAEIKQNSLIDKKKEAVLDLENKIADLTDLAPKQSTSLTIKEVDPEVWVKDLHNAKVQKLNAEIELEVAQKTYNEWFSEDEQS